MSGAHSIAAELLYREAYYLDTQDWDAWIALFMEDCEYWVPAWKSEHELTDDPKRELSLVYYPTRAGLQDRTWRVQSKRSVASTPMPRTHRVISNILIQSKDNDDSMTVSALWTVHQFKTKTRHVEVSFGRSEQTLVRVGDDWRIGRKKIILLNDYMPEMMDFYCL